MSAFWISLAGLVAALVCSEAVLAGAKLQTGLLRVLTVFAGIGGVLLVYIITRHGAAAIPFVIYWSGAFLCWFGVRSHIESSILLHMLHLLRNGEMTEEQLLDAYERHYGMQLRVEELVRAGLTEKGDDGFHVTPKGRFIVTTANWLR